MFHCSDLKTESLQSCPPAELLKRWCTIMVQCPTMCGLHKSNPGGQMGKLFLWWVAEALLYRFKYIYQLHFAAFPTIYFITEQMWVVI